MIIGKVNFKFNENLDFVFDLTQYKKEIRDIIIKYLLEEISANQDEEKSEGFWALAEKIIDDNCSFIWNYPLSCDLQELLYENLINYAPVVMKEIIKLSD